MRRTWVDCARAVRPWDGFGVNYVEGDRPKELRLGMRGTAHTAFDAYRTGPDEAYLSLRRYAVHDGVIAYAAPPKTVTTFFGA